MTAWTKRLLTLLLTLCFFPALAASADGDSLSLEWRSDGTRQAELVLRGLEDRPYGVQLELTLEGVCEDLSFIPRDGGSYSPACRVESLGGRTSVTVYLVSSAPLASGALLELGTLVSATDALPEAGDAALTLLDRDLQPIRGANGTRVDLWDRQDTSGGSDSDLSSQGYRIQLEQPEHGTLRSSTLWAEEGEDIILTVRPDTGYTLDRLSVRCGSRRNIDLKDLGENRFRFVMPDGKVLVTADLLPVEDPLPAAMPFTDISPTDWFYEAASYVYRRGMMRGTTDTTFSPYVTTNRGMIVTILHRLEGEPASAVQGRFTDVPADMYCAAAVAWAAENGIVGGYGNGTFGPRDTITRQQLAAILHRYAAYKGYDTMATGSLGDFPDGLGVSPYAQDAVRWAIGHALLLKDEAGLLSPQAGATRAQAAYALTGLCLDIAGLAP